MTEILLCDALRSFLSEALKDLAMRGKDGKLKPPKIVNGFLPLRRRRRPNESPEDDDYPFVIVRAEGGQLEREESGQATNTTHVTFIVGAYTDPENPEDENGHEFLLNALARIRGAFGRLDGLCLNKQFVLKYPITWKMLEEQPYPYWILEIETTWVFVGERPPLEEFL